MTLKEAFDAARRHHTAGELQQAEMIYHQILAADPRQPDALHQLGLLAFQCNQPDAAIELIRRAISIHPGEADFHYNLAHILASGGRQDEAIEEYWRAIALKPDFFQAYHNLGGVLEDRGLLPEAIDVYRKAIALQPRSAESYGNLSGVLSRMGDNQAAMETADQAVSLRPDGADGYISLGAAHLRAGDVQGAIASLRRAIALDHASARAHQALGMALLLCGELEMGWREHEWRRLVPELQASYPRHIQPMWDGSELDGRRILLEHEQGWGDTIQMVRYAPMIASRGGKVVLGVPPELARLMRGMDGVEQVVTARDPALPFDVYCPLLSLPYLFKTTLDTIPAAGAYLKADSQLAWRWRERLAGHARVCKIGLVWAGGPSHRDDRYRSMPLSMLSPLAQAPAARFFSLQKGTAARQISPVSSSLEIIDWTSELEDFADTAAFIENLDLLISVDTAVAHLGGALGKPVWLLLPFIPDWRWMLDRSDSPWYPTMRLFRQPWAGDWATPVNQIVEALRSLDPVGRIDHLRG